MGFASVIALHSYVHFFFEQEILLRRAADSLEAFYAFPKGQGATGPLNHIGPAIYTTNYPRSPALFTPAILTPQGFTTTARWNPSFAAGTLVSPTKMDGGYSHIPPGEVVRKIPAIDGEGSTASVGSHSSGDETLQQQQQGQEQHQQGQDVDHNTNSASFFTFSPGMHDTMSHTEIKHEMHNPSDIHKPKPITPGPHLYPVAMPFVQVAAPMHSQGPPYSAYSMTPYSNTEPGSFMSAHAGVDGSNRNNNNNSNATFATYAAGFGNHMMAMNQVFIPPSPGFFMAPTGMLKTGYTRIKNENLMILHFIFLLASPGPLPATPTGPGGSSIFNFNSPPRMVSPSKPFKPVNDITPTKGNKHAVMTSETMGSVHGNSIVNYPTSAMFAGKLKN